MVTSNTFITLISASFFTWLSSLCDCLSKFISSYMNISCKDIIGFVPTLPGILTSTYFLRRDTNQSTTHSLFCLFFLLFLFPFFFLSFLQQMKHFLLLSLRLWSQDVFTQHWPLPVSLLAGSSFFVQPVKFTKPGTWSFTDPSTWSFTKPSTW